MLLLNVSSIAADRVINPCTKGPAYWCADPSNSRKCGIKSNICEKYKEHLCDPTTTTTTRAPIGSNPCTWGPSYWCASKDNAKKCGLTVTDCAKYGGIKNTAAAP